jgi:hypothetical protein
VGLEQCAADAGVCPLADRGRLGELPALEVWNNPKLKIGVEALHHCAVFERIDVKVARGAPLVGSIFPIVLGVMAGARLCRADDKATALRDQELLLNLGYCGHFLDISANLGKVK